MGKLTSNLAAAGIIVAFIYSQNAGSFNFNGSLGELLGSLTSTGTLSNPVPGASETSGFGMRFDPVMKKTQLHAGQDFGVAVGTPIHAAADGTVSSVAPTSSSGGYGNYTCIDHGNDLSTCYAHQSEIDVVKGQNVTRGQVIGLSGQTGAATGPHLHFEVREHGKPVNPLSYLG